MMPNEITATIHIEAATLKGAKALFKEQVEVLGLDLVSTDYEVERGEDLDKYTFSVTHVVGFQQQWNRVHPNDF